MKRAVIVFVLICFAPAVFAQKKKKSAVPFNSLDRNEHSKFLDKQWWLGFKAGPNLSSAAPVKRYTVLTPTNYSTTATEKQYRAFTKTGMQATLEATFNFKGIALSFQPTVRSARFTYESQMEWRSTENPADRLELKFEHDQRIDHFDFPLLAKYELLGNRLRPYVQIGVFYSVLLNATKAVTVSGADYASGGTNTFKNEPVIVGAKDLFVNSWGLLGGIGANYNVGNVRLVLDVSYRQGMSNIANVDSRFSNDRLTGIGDAQDDLRLNNIMISTGCLFPLRFISRNYLSGD